jgi:hypothetical protein
MDGNGCHRRQPFGNLEKNATAAGGTAPFRSRKGIQATTGRLRVSQATQCPRMALVGKPGVGTTQLPPLTTPRMATYSTTA